MLLSAAVITTTLLSVPERILRVQAKKMNENPPPPPNNNDNDEDAAAAAANIPLVEDGHDDDDDENEGEEVGIDSDEEDHNEEDHFGPPVLPEDHSDDDNDDEDEDEDDGDEDGDGDADADDDFMDDPAEQERICQEAMAILLNRLNFPSPQRDRAIVHFAQQFVTNVKEDIHKTITDTRTVDEGYDGLDNERDTEKEVDTAIRCCPEVLSQRDDRFGLYPIHCVTFMQDDDDNTRIMRNRNEKAVSFVHLFAKLAIEFTLFEEHERGGLLIADEEGLNVLHDLMYTSDPSFDEERHERIDTSFLAVLIRLRQSSYFVHEDIQQHHLVHELCKEKMFANQRFRFLTEIDPASLLQTDENGLLPLHWATYAIHKFRPVCDAVFRYYPKWKGIQLLHQKETVHAQTPFQLASHYFGHTAALTIVDETLARYSETVLPDIPKALILAASEERIHVECVYFLLKRQPDITISTLQQHYDRSPGSVLASSSSTNSSNRSRRRTSRNTHNRIVRRSTRKRKRN